MLRSCHLVRVTVAVASLSLASACGPDLGPCDLAAATQVIYKRGPSGTGCKSPSGCGGAFPDPVTYYLPFTPGQALAQSSCGNGGVCHSASATGALRHGAPAGLNFDLAMIHSPTRSGVLRDGGRGHAKLVDRLEDSWALIDDGSMPPGEIGAALQGASRWFAQSSQDLDPAERFEVQDAQLPPLNTAAGKEVMRNWLACGAPVVNGNVEVGQRGPDQIPPTWDAIHELLISNSCTVCHSGVAEPLANGSLLLSDPCASWLALVNRAPSTSSLCTSFQGALVVPSNPGASLLMQKLDADPFAETPEVCGFPMPLSESRLSELDRNSVRTWIMNGALPPSDCN